MGWGPAPRGRGRRYGYGRPGRRVRGHYRARPRARGPIPVNRGGCLLPMLLGLVAGPALARAVAARAQPPQPWNGRWVPGSRNQ
jgi:hypothetical protein